MTGSTDKGPMVAVRRFIDGFNSDDIALALTACADEMTIIDDFAPFEWSGNDAMLAWSSDMNEMAAEYGMSAWSVTLDEVRMEIVAEPGAYVVVPIDVRWLDNGAPAERCGFMTMALRTEAREWRISRLVWTWG